MWAGRGGIKVKSIEIPFQRGIHSFTGRNCWDGTGTIFGQREEIRKHMRTAVVDVGGGLRGIYAAGVLDRCMEDKVYFDVGIGVSAGSAMSLLI